MTVGLFANGRVDFSNEQAFTLLGSAHSLGTAALIPQLYDNGLPYAERIQGSITVHPSSYNVGVAFSQSQSGYLLLAAEIHASKGKTFTNATSVTFAGTEHLLGTPNLLVDVYDGSGRRLRVRTRVHQTSYDVLIDFPIQTTGLVVVAPATPSGLPANPTKTFTTTTTWSFPRSEHGRPTRHLLVQLYDAQTPAMTIDADLVINPTTFNITTTYPNNQSGQMVIGGAGVEILLAATAGGTTLAGQTATFRIVMPAAAGAVSLQGGDATLRYGQITVLQADPGAVTLAGGDVILRKLSRLHAEAGAVNLAGGLLTPQVMLPAAAGATSLAGGAVLLRHLARLPADVGAVLLGAAQISFQVRMQASAGPVALAGQAVGFQIRMPAAPGALTLTGADANLIYSAQTRLDAEPGATLLQGGPVALRVVMAAGTGQATLTGGDVTFIYHRRLRAEPGAIILGSPPALLRWSRYELRRIVYPTEVHYVRANGTVVTIVPRIRLPHPR